MESSGTTYEKEFNLNTLLFHILVKWRIIIVSCVLFMVILGIYKFNSEIGYINNPEAMKINDKANQEAITAYKEDRDELVSDIEKLEVKIDRQKEYNDNSILMKLDPYNVYKATGSYYITSENGNSTAQNHDTNLRKSIIKAYENLVVNGDMCKYISDRLSFNLDKKYLMELITVTADYDSNTLFIQVLFNEEDKCNELFGLVTDYIDGLKSNIIETITDYEITEMNISHQTVIDINYDSIQSSNINALQGYKDRLLKNNNTLKAFPAPPNTLVTIKTLIRDTLVFMAIGFLLGGFAAVAFIIFMNMISDKVIDFKDLYFRFNLRILGSINKPHKKRIFRSVDRLIAKIIGGNKQPGDDEAVKIITMNVKAICELNNIVKGNILVTGTISSEKIRKVQQLLAANLKEPAYQFVSSDNISYNADTIEQMKNCDAVIITEEAGSSSFTEISKQMVYLNNYEKTILGVILM